MPYFLSSFLEPETITLTLWAKFKRKIKFNLHEKYLCLIEGHETFRIVNFTNKQHMKIGMKDDIPYYDSPLDMFADDFGKVYKEGTLH